MMRGIDIHFLGIAHSGVVHSDIWILSLVPTDQGVLIWTRVAVPCEPLYFSATTPLPQNFRSYAEFEAPGFFILGGSVSYLLLA